FQQDQELQQTQKWVETFPSACPHCLWGGKVRVQLYDPDYMKVILGTSNSKIPENCRFLAPWIGYGLPLLNGQKWHQHWRMLTPAFHYDILKSYMGLMADSIHMILDKWEELIGQDSPLEVFQHVSLMTLDTIMKCALNIQLDRDIQSYIQAIGDLKLFPARAMSFIKHASTPTLMLRSTGHPHGGSNHCSGTDRAIQLRKAHLKEEGELEKVRRKRHLDFLDILLLAKMENESSLSDKDLRSEADTFMFGGHDTTASGISWILYALATHPKHQQRCQEEIQSFLGDGASITWDRLDKMPYTTMGIKEVLRLYPLVPGIGRELSTPITFPDGRSLPKGLKVTLSICGLHHNPKMWSNPEVRRPWRRMISQAQHIHAFLPFSGGSSQCISFYFILFKLNVATALTLLCFELLPDPTRIPIPIPRVVLKSSSGIHLNLRKLP
ncbi:hypothetical protein EGK_00729, partial [Macaca mulatta]